MAAFMSSEILDHALFSAKTSRPVFYIGKPTVSNGGCSFRSIHWSPPDSPEEKRLLMFRNTEPIEIFHGITRHAATPHAMQQHHTPCSNIARHAATPHAMQQHSSPCSNTDVDNIRDSLALKMASPDFCSKLLASLRGAEREIEFQLREVGDRHGLTRITKPDATEPNQSVTWFNLKNNLPCSTFRADIAEKTLYEVPAASLVGLTGFYIVAIQATSLYLPRAASYWRIAYAVRAVIYISDPSRPPISLARGLETTFPGFCFVSTSAPEAPPRAPALPVCATPANTEGKEETASIPARARKRKAPAATQRDVVKAATVKASDTQYKKNTAAKKQHAMLLDWVECPPAKSVGEASRNKSAVSFKIPKKASPVSPDSVSSAEELACDAKSSTSKAASTGKAPSAQVRKPAAKKQHEMLSKCLVSTPARKAAGTSKTAPPLPDPSEEESDAQASNTSDEASLESEN